MSMAISSVDAADMFSNPVVKEHRMKTLIIAAHPDDEILGAGGFMATHPGTMVAIVSEGTSVKAARNYYDQLSKKKAALESAATLLQAVIVAQGEFADQRLTLNRNVQEWIENTILENHPDQVLTHVPWELNKDHRVVAEATMVACRPYTKTGKGIQSLLGFTVDPLALYQGQTWGIVYQRMNEDHMEMKVAALRRYFEQGFIEESGHPHSLRTVNAQLEQHGSLIGCPGAERYHLLWGQV